MSERLYDKRKLAALELEQVVRDDLASGDRDHIQAVINELCQDFAYAVRHPNYRNGGLIGLAGVAIALGQQELPAFLDDIIQPILACFGDADSRVRYYACESLYNVAKVAKGEILQYFNEIFDVLSKLIADSEEGVRNGADLVDHLIKDIVAEKAATYTFQVLREMPSAPQATTAPDGDNGPQYQTTDGQHANHFSLRSFIPLLVERIYVINPSTRMFLIQWIMLLDSIPDLELVVFLPEFLEGLLHFLSDPNREVRALTRSALTSFLKEIRVISSLKHEPHPSKDGLYKVGQDMQIDYAKILNTLLDNLDSGHQEIQLVVLEWLDVFLTVSPEDVVSNLPHLVSVLLPALSDESSPEVRPVGQHLSENVRQFLNGLGSSNYHIDEEATVNALTLQFNNESKITRMAALVWLGTLQKAGLANFFGSTLVVLLRPLSDSSEEVVSQDLDLLSQVLRAAPDPEFENFMRQLFKEFESNRDFLTVRGKLVCSSLATSLNPERFYRVSADILREDYLDRDFASVMVQNLTNILIMVPDLAPLRSTLKSLWLPQGAALFTQLFKAWGCNSVSALALCLLAEAYEHAFAVLQILASLDVKVSTLVQIDRLIQLIEGPVFAPLRLHLLEPRDYPYLYKTLYGLLMVLPQSSAFKILHTRLQSVVSIGQLPLPSSSTPESASQLRAPSAQVDWNGLLEGFRKLHLPPQSQ